MTEDLWARGKWGQYTEVAQSMFAPQELCNRIEKGVGSQNRPLNSGTAGYDSAA